MLLLQAAELPFLVGGAFALGSYTGITRDTKDFDIFMRESDVDAALRLFREKGFHASVAFSHWLAKIHHGEAFIDIIFNSGNGLCPVDEQWFQNARSAQLLDVEVGLVPPEEMIWQKAYIMERERFDGADIAHLLRASANSLDWPHLLGRFGPDSSVLLAHLVLFGFIYPSRRSLIPAGVMNELLARFASESLASGESDEKLCNGTFLSRAQYLPDIERWGFQDARLTSRTRISPEQLQFWTSAIDLPAHH